MKIPQCLPTDDALTQLEMIAWLTIAGARLEDSDVFARESVRFEQGAAELARMAAPATGILSANAISREIVGRPLGERQANFEKIAMACLTLTGQSDNALKCQFPVFLQQGPYSNARDLVGLAEPSTKKPYLSVINMERVGQRIASRGSDTTSAIQLLEAYFDCLFARANMSRLQGAVAIIRGVSALERTLLLEVMAVSAIRGSATASGGHAPEEKLRCQMEEWGLVRGYDFNTSDVAAPELAELCGHPLAAVEMGRAEKSRAFDFVVPYKVPGRLPQLLVQGQFYAGDSGSVSHKNVDQTPTGRTAAARVVRDPINAEFLDGAGYVTALKGDAQRLLKMQGTDGLIQLRTAAIRLRELLQRIAFATPLEAAHAVWASPRADRESVIRGLSATYGEVEAKRALARGIQLGWIDCSANLLLVRSERCAVSLEYAILDSTAIGAMQPRAKATLSGFAVPGYGMDDWYVSEPLVRQRLETLLPGMPPGLVESSYDDAVERLKSQGRLRVVS